MLKMTRRQMASGLAASLLTFAGGRADAAGVAAVKALKPGEFIWRPEVSPRGPVVIVVSLPEQLVHVYRNGVTIGVSTCSSGKLGHRTPTGVFTILQKRQEHYSSTYNNAPMPNMQRLTWQGVALHAGDLPGYPASHGCVRLPKNFSKLLFTVTQLSTPVIIADQKTAYSSVVRPDLILPKDIAETAQEAQAGTNKSKNPSADANTKVASILVSGADRKAYLVVDGELVFETPISVLNPEQPLGTHLFSLIGPSPDGFFFRWAAFGLGGQPRMVLPSTCGPAPSWHASNISMVRCPARCTHAAARHDDGDHRSGGKPETRSAPDFTS